MVKLISLVRPHIPILYGFFPSPFGECAIALLDDKPCALAFVDKIDRNLWLEEMKKQWPGYVFTINKNTVQKYTAPIMSGHMFKKIQPRDVTLQGTPFQVKVWYALICIPPGKRVSYSLVAAMINNPAAVRAVANAIAQNPIALLVPCHRVVLASGAIGGYRWGSARKKALLEWEDSLCQ
jgi:AraC family transcriptional regulator of adaptative response/methylated-DNA-[protein]-cysteine methyltransferase